MEEIERFERGIGLAEIDSAGDAPQVQRTSFAFFGVKAIDPFSQIVGLLKKDQAIVNIEDAKDARLSGNGSPKGIATAGDLGIHTLELERDRANHAQII